MEKKLGTETVAAVYDRRMENQLGAQGFKLTVEGLFERLHGTTR
jgi:hypothetical protein